MNFRVGDQVLSYEVIDVLGAGGMGEVYKVRNRISDRIEAMKVLLADLQAHPDLADRFLREIKVQARLTHPNIAGLHTAFEFDGKLVMILEMIEGVTVSQRLKSGPLSAGEAIGYTAQALDALDYAHRLGVTHRDVKPANMMITSGGALKLMDFGIAKAATEKTLTRTGGLIGTLHYMSPEQIHGGAPLDGRTDLYSLGIVLYEMLTGRKPFDGPSDFSIMKAHLEEPPVPPERLDPSVPAPLSRVILRALAKRPEDRYQTAAEFREELVARAPFQALPKESKPLAERPPLVSSTPAAESRDLPRDFAASWVLASPPKPEREDSSEDDFERAFGPPPSASGTEPVAPPAAEPKPSPPAVDPGYTVYRGPPRAMPPPQPYAVEAEPPTEPAPASHASSSTPAARAGDAPARRSQMGLYAGLAAGVALAVAIGFQVPRWLSDDAAPSFTESVSPAAVSPPESGDPGADPPANAPGGQPETARSKPEAPAASSPPAVDPGAPGPANPSASRTRSAPRPDAADRSAPRQAASTPGVTRTEPAVSSAPSPSPDPNDSAPSPEDLNPSESGASAVESGPRNETGPTSRTESEQAPVEPRAVAEAPAPEPPPAPTPAADAAAASPSSESAGETPAAGTSAPTPPPEDRVYEINEVDMKPQLVHQVQPAYSPTDPRRRVRGRVRLSGEIWPDGKPHNIQVVKGIGDEALDRSAVQAFGQWRFVAGRKSGHPVKTRVTVDMAFQVF